MVHLPGDLWGISIGLYTNASKGTSDTYAIAIKGSPDAAVYFSSITPLTGIALELSNRGDVY